MAEADGMDDATAKRSEDAHERCSAHAVQRSVPLDF